MNKDNANDQSLLIERLKQGDSEAFAELVEQYSNAIYRIALRFTSESQDAEDVLQETFIKAYKALPEFEGRSSLSTWLYRIAVNEALMLLRKRNPKLVSIEQTAPDDENEEIENDLALADWCCLPEDVLLSGEARSFLNEAVERLPETLRSVFLLRDIEGLSIHDTAETLGLTETNIKTRLLRARLHLRQDLTRYFGPRLAEVIKEDE
jgi:RNA polymerase sigma-70 factor (ECF subfamily)